jgi:SOS-response transcriptional repressor LexA
LTDPDAIAARVVGQSMTPAYAEGDIVVFSPQADVTEGCDAFARLEPDHETTFKQVFFEGEAGSEQIRLQPVNEQFPPWTLPRQQVAGLYRAVMKMSRL